MNEGQAFFRALEVAHCAVIAPWLEWVQYTVALTIAVAYGNFIAGELRAFFSWLLPAVWAAAARLLSTVRNPERNN